MIDIEKRYQRLRTAKALELTVKNFKKVKVWKAPHIYKSLMKTLEELNG